MSRPGETQGGSGRSGQAQVAQEGSERLREPEYHSSAPSFNPFGLTGTVRRLLNCRINNLRGSMLLSCSCYVFWAPWPRECIQLPNICLERVLGIGYVCGHAAH